MKLKYTLCLLLLVSNSLLAKTAMLTFPYSQNATLSYAQSYDLYLPDNANASTPLFAFVHGGYWVQDDSDYGFGENIAEHLTQHGFAVALIRYRLAPEHTHPAQINDVSLGFNRLLKQLDSRSYNASCIVAAGHSAGGHLVSLMALDTQYLNAYKLKATQLHSVFSLSGVYDLIDASGKVNERIKQLYQSVFGASRAQRADASPISYSQQQNPPMVLLYGSDDFSGFERDAKLFYQSLVKTGKDNVELHPLSQRNHFQVVDTRLNQAELLRLIQSKVNCD